MRTVRSNGVGFNVSDFLFGDQRDSLGWNALNNNASTLSLRVGPIAATTYYFGLRVPAGKVFVLFNRVLTVSEGVFNVDVCSDSGTFTTTGATELTQHPIDESSDETILSQVWAGVTPAGIVTEEEWGFVDTGTNLGSARAGGAAGTESLIKRFTGDSLLRLENADAGTTNYTATLRLVAWEEDL